MIKKTNTLFFIVLTWLLFSCHEQHVHDIKNKDISANQSKYNVFHEMNSKNFMSKAHKIKDQENKDSILHYLKLAIAENNKLASKDFVYTDSIHRMLTDALEADLSYEEALKQEQAMLVFFDENPNWDKTKKMHSYMQVAKCHLMLGEPNKSIEEALLPAEKLLIKLESEARDGHALVKERIGLLGYFTLCYSNLGDFQQTQIYVNKISVFDRQTTKTNDDVKLHFEDAYSTVIDHYINIGKYEDATDFIRRWQNLYGKHTPKALIRINDKEAKIANKQEQFDWLEKLHHEAEHIYRNDTDKDPIIKHYYKNSLERYARLLLANKRYEEAKAVSQNVFALFTDMPETFYNNKVYCYDIIAKAHLAQNNTDSARYYYELCEESAKTIGHIRNFLMAKLRKTELFCSQKMYIPAEAEWDILYTTIVNTNERVRERIFTSGASFQVVLKTAKMCLDAFADTDDIRHLQRANQFYLLGASMEHIMTSANNFASFNPDNVGIINNGILRTLYLSAKHPEAIPVDKNLEALELNQTIELIYKNRIQHILQEDERIPKDLVMLKNQLEKAYFETENTIFSLGFAHDAESKTKVLQDENNAIRHRLDSIYQEIESLDQNFALYLSPKIELATVQQKIRNNEILLRYFFSDNDLYLFKVDKKSIAFEKIGSKEDVTTHLKTYLLQIRQRDGDADKNPIHQLLTAGLKPNGKEKLLIVPHQTLQLVPFEALIRGEKYLLEDYTIGYMPSLHFLLNKPAKSTKGQMVCFSPDYGSSELTQLFPELGSTSSEVALISKLYDSQVYMGQEATKENFVNLNDYPSILHLAMHTTHIENEQYGLVFSGKDIPSSVLSTTDIYGQHIPSNLTVLSACETGLGKIDPNEGVMSLSRAFMYSGSKSTLMSLWRVPDQATALVMTAFYENLNKGQSKDKALQNAKLHYLSTIEDPNLKHPYYWGGFVVTGDMSTVSDGFPYWYWMLGLFGLVGLVMVVLGNKKKG